MKVFEVCFVCLQRYVFQKLSSCAVVAQVPEAPEVNPSPKESEAEARVAYRNTAGELSNALCPGTVHMPPNCKTLARAASAAGPAHGQERRKEGFWEMPQKRKGCRASRGGGEGFSGGP